MTHSRRSRLSPHEIEEIRGLHRAGFSIREIAEKTGRSLGSVSNYVKPQDNDKPSEKKCPKCGQLLPPQAHFCFICGTKILTERESIIENLAHTRDSFALIPSNARDAFISAVNGAISYLEGLPDE